MLTWLKNVLLDGKMYVCISKSYYMAIFGREKVVLRVGIVITLL